MPLYTAPRILGKIGGGRRAPDIVGTGTAFFSSSGSNSYTIAHTVPAGANCLAVCLGACRGSGSYEPTVTWNGGAVAELARGTGFTFNRGVSLSWIGAVILPTSGTRDIVVGFDVAPDNMALYALNLAGVDTSSPVADAEGRGTFFFNFASLGATLETALPSLVFGGMSLAQPSGAVSIVPAAGVTEIVEGTASGAAAARQCFGYRREGVGGAYEFAATASQSSSCSLAAVAFKGA